MAVKSKSFNANCFRNEEIKLGNNKRTKTVAFHKLFSFADSIDVLLMILGTIGAIGNGLRMPIMAILFGQLTDAFGNINPNTFNDIVHIVSKVSLKFVYLGLGVGVAAFLQVACWMATGERQAARIRSLYLKAILRQDVAFFDKEANTGEIVERMSGDTALIQDAMGEKVGKFLQLIATFIGGVVVALNRGWLLTLVLASTIPLLVAAGAFTSIIIAKMASRGQCAYAKAANVVEQTISSIRTVASFTGEKRAISDYKVFLVSAYRAGVLEGLHAGLGLGMVMMVIFFTYALATWYGSKLVLEKGYTGSMVVNVIIAVLAASMSLGMASPCITAFAAGQAAAFKMFETIARKPEVDAEETEGVVLEDIHGDIELRDVSFRYPTRPNERTLDRFSLLVPGGTTAALVGQSGSGKSTVINLIERFYDPQAGKVLIDGVNVKDFRQSWIRGKIGLVSQEPALFACSISDNILYGKDDATAEEIRAAIELANASAFIDKLPKGLDTMVGDHGTQLSGGQKQRIAIARALLRDPRILLLDEATSALDAESEKVVQKALDQIMVDRTTVIVAHRLSTVKNADLIAVIRNGKIAEKGLHSELIKDHEGPYSQLIKLQEVNSISQTKPIISNINVESSQQSIETQTILPLQQRSQRQDSPVPENISNPTAGQNQQPRKVPIRRLALLNKQELPVLLGGTLFAAANGVILPLLGLIISSSIKTLYELPEELKRDSRRWSVLFAALGGASLVVVPARSYLFAVAGCNLIRRVRLLCFQRAVCMEIGWFDEGGGAVGARLSASAAAVRALVGDAAALLVENVASTVAGLAIAFAACWQLALVVVVLFPLLGVTGYFQLMFLKGFSSDAKNMYEEASQIAKDAVGSIRTVASFCAEEKVIQLYKEKCESPVKAGIRQGLISGIGFGFSLCLIFCVYATSFYAGARFLKAGKASVLDVFRVFFALTMAAFAISQSSSLLPDSTKANDAAAAVFAIIDRKSKIDPSDESGVTLDNVVGEIELHGVSFCYPSRPDVQIFHNLNLTIHSEKIVALVGESGGGKSTVISLLQRFYDPDSGYITLDGIEIRKLQLKWLRQQMGLVSQEPILFNDTIRANIAYGCEGLATEAEILEAAKLAKAHKFISGLQQGYDTMVGERGAQLSGGQKQRVAIARAIIKSPKILLLDEATSALDAESERAVQSALDRVMVGRTTVIVAHRLSTIKKAHSIAVLKNGVIVEKGNHEALINIDHGLYASLVALNHLGNN